VFKGAFKYLGRAIAIGAIEHLAKKGYLCSDSASLGAAAGPADGTRLITLDTVPSFRFRPHPPGLDEYISEQIRWHGIWEPLETEIIVRLAPLFDLFLDVGANIGWFTALAREIMPSGATVHAFEPDIRNFALLKENAGRGDRVQVHPVAVAVSDAVGTARLYRAATNLGDHRLYASEEGRSSDEVPVTTLDRYFSGRALPPRLVKMDTQGSEAKILRGAKATLQDGNHASAYLIEFWPEGMNQSGEDVGAFISLLSSFPQQPFMIDRVSHGLCPSNWDDVRRLCSEGALVQEDFVLVTTGSAAHLALADLIRTPAAA